MTHLAIQPLLAADGWQTAIGLIIFIFFSVLQWLGNREEAKRKKQPRPKPQQPRQGDLDGGLPQRQNQGLGNQGPPNQEETLRSEVEEFLRRAQGKPQPAKPEQMSPPKKLSQPAGHHDRPRPQRKRPSAPATSIASAARLDSKGSSLRNEGVAEHVSRHISTRDIATHTEMLGAEVATADDQLKSRLHEKFDHAVGHLQHREQQVDTERKTDMAAEVAAMLRSPEGMRQLIIANEILRRPEW